MENTKNTKCYCLGVPGGRRVLFVVCLGLVLTLVLVVIDLAAIANNHALETTEMHLDVSGRCMHYTASILCSHDHVHVT
jgi:hypothetical protein